MPLVFNPESPLASVGCFYPFNRRPAAPPSRGHFNSLPGGAFSVTLLLLCPASFFNGKGHTRRISDNVGASFYSVGGNEKRLSNSEQRKKRFVAGSFGKCDLWRHSGVAGIFLNQTATFP